MAQKAEQIHGIRTDTAHDETHVLMLHSMPVNNLRMTEAEAEALIAGLQHALAGLREYRKDPAAYSAKHAKQERRL